MKNEKLENEIANEEKKDEKIEVLEDDNQKQEVPHKKKKNIGIIKMNPLSRTK